MKRLLSLFIISIIIVSGVFVILPTTTPKAHAQNIGTVCIARGITNKCPLTPPMLNSTRGPPAPQLILSIVINGSDSLIGFDITLKADHNYLKPASADVTKGILKSPSILADCIGGPPGTGCTGTDNADTLHVAAASQTPTISPTTGLLFTANYTIVGNTLSIPIKFQTGCTNTSVSGGICVTASSGASTPDQETVQTARFSDQGYFDFQPIGTVVSLTIPPGSSATTLQLNVTSLNGYSGSVTLAVTPVPASSGITVTFTTNPLVVTSTLGLDQALTGTNVTVSTSVTPGNYILNFTATGTGVTSTPNILLIPLTIPAPDYTITASPGQTAATPLNFNVSATGQSTITLTSINNYAGRINLTLGIPAGLHASFNGPSTVSLLLKKGGTNTTTVSAFSAIAGGYKLNVTGVSTGLIPHTQGVFINVFDFQMSTTAGTIVLDPGKNTTKTIAVGAVGNVAYAVNVTISKIEVNQITINGPVGPSFGLTVTCNPLKLNITISGTGSQPQNTQCRVIANTSGNYTVTVSGTAGKNNLVTHILTFPVIVTGPDFTATPTPAIQTVDQGKNSTVSLFIAAQNGLKSNVTLSGTFTSATGATPLPIATFSVGFTPLSLTLRNGTSYGRNGTVIINIYAFPTTPVGPYTLTLDALATASSQHHFISIIAVVTTTASSHDLAILRASPSKTSATIGDKIDITIIVANLGKFTESSTVLALAGPTTVGRANVTLTPGQNMTVTITWDTTGYAATAYMVAGEVLSVPNEGNLDNNLWRFDTPVTLSAANTNPFSSGLLAPSIIGVLIIIVAVIAIMLIQSRRKIPATPSQ